MVIEAGDMDEAVAIGSEWPTLTSQPRASLGVQEVFGGS
jgi:hypothetical protein